VTDVRSDGPADLSQLIDLLRACKEAGAAIHRELQR